LTRFLIACLCTVYLSSAIAKNGPSPYPSEAGDWPGEGVIRVFDWMKPNRESFWRQREQKQGAWVLAGDSLLGNWRTSQRDLEPRNTANRAIGGDVSRGLLFRFQEDVLDLNPRGIVLLIGGNDLSALQPTDQTARNIGRMLDAIRTWNASVPVILCTLPPRDSTKAPIKHSELLKLNTSIKQLAAAHENVTILDLFPLFATADGQPRAELFTKDRLHISPAGYQVLREAVNDSMG
jgi:lysophospholipase L1-like esterase